MTRKKGVRATLLVEDRAMERLACEVLRRLGFSSREMRVKTSPAGQGSAKQWVEKQYPTEARAYRSKASYQQIALLVGTDADEQTVQHRFDRLSSALTDVEPRVPDRAANERIAIWVPKRNVETWILHLSSGNVDEETNYKTRIGKPNYRTVSQAFVDHFRESGSEDHEVLPSLQVGFTETARLDL